MVRKVKNMKRAYLIFLSALTVILVVLALAKSGLFFSPYDEMEQAEIDDLGHKRVICDDSDADKDGYPICENDCDDNNPDINPGKSEDDTNLCYDGIDNNCNSFTDCSDLSCNDKKIFYGPDLTLGPEGKCCSGSSVSLYSIDNCGECGHVCPGDDAICTEEMKCFSKSAWTSSFNSLFSSEKGGCLSVPSGRDPSGRDIVQEVYDLAKQTYNSYTSVNLGSGWKLSVDPPKKKVCLTLTF